MSKFFRPQLYIISSYFLFEQSVNAEPTSSRNERLRPSDADEYTFRTETKRHVAAQLAQSHETDTICTRASSTLQPMNFPLLLELAERHHSATDPFKCTFHVSSIIYTHKQVKGWLLEPQFQCHTKKGPAPNF